MNLGKAFSSVLASERSAKTAVPAINEPIVVIGEDGKRIGMCFGDGVTQLKDLELIGSSSTTLSTTKTISSAEILSSNTSPIELLPEIAIDRGYEILSIQCKYTYNGVKYTANLDAEIKFTNSASLISIIDLAFAETRIEYLDVNKVVLGGLPVVFQTRGGNPSTGNGMLELTIEYKIIELDLVDSIYQNFIDRAINDGGTVENLSGLNDFINQLTIIE